MGFIFANEAVSAKIKMNPIFEHEVVITVPLQSLVDARVSNHIDLSMFVDGLIFIHVSIAAEIKTQMLNYVNEKWYNQHVVVGNSELINTYPQDIPYNAVKLERHFFHRLDKTERAILDWVQKNPDCIITHVNQGYTRCSSLVIGNRAVITEDAGLYQHYKSLDYDVLLIETGHVKLSGFPNGFIGGAGGNISNQLVLNGSLKHHPSEKDIKAFIKRQNYKLVELDDEPLEDCGSIFYYPHE